MIIMAAWPKAERECKVSTPITTQQIPDMLERWSKNRRKKDVVLKNP
jgi:hypothetical protein